MAIFQKPRGTTDWYGIEFKKFNFIINKLSYIAQNYGFEQIDVPAFESIELFQKSIGEETDINKKELYTLVDKKNRIFALRPEGTSSVVRAYVENKIYANKSTVTKFFYELNLFRYERPQSGRLREFHQFGIEYLNVNSYLCDIECLLFAYEIIKSFNLKNCITLKINYLGNFNQRKEWMKELTKYFENFQDELTIDSINRIYKNPLRILDDKVDSKKDFVKNAPKLEKYLTDKDKSAFDDILSSLKANNIDYEIDYSLVRGLDYYTGIVFEFVYNDKNNPNNNITIIGGGRYSNLVKQTGGPDHIGLGFALGIERLLMILNATNYKFYIDCHPVIFIGASNYDNSLVAMKLINELRSQGIYAEMIFELYKKDKNAHNALKFNSNYFAYFDDNYQNDKLIHFEDLNLKNVKKITLSELLDTFK